MNRFVDKNLLLQFIRGKWRFDREVRASANGRLMASICDGRASFLPWEYEEPVATNPHDKDDRLQSIWLIYREGGYLDNKENVPASGNVTRQYLYEFPKVKPINIYHCTTKKDMNAVTDPLAEFASSGFMENGFFHELMFEYPIGGAPSGGDESNLTDVSAQVDQECKPDTYKGIIDIINGNRYSSKWSVTGPQKSFEIHTIYERLLE
jgi:hypothetical protein